MTDKVRQLHAVAPVTVDAEIRAEVVEKLERALAMAKDGKVSEVLVIALHEDGDYTQLASHTQSLSQWIGLLEITKSDWIHQCREEEDHG